MFAPYGFLAYFALTGVIVTALAVLASKRPEDTCITLILAAIMFLPMGAHFKIPKVPPLNRDTLPYLCLLITYGIRRAGWLRKSRPGRGVEILIPISMVAAVLTITTNPDPLFWGSWTRRILPALQLNDGLAMAFGDLLIMGVPFYLGRVLMRSPREATRLLIAFALGGLVYSLFVLVEVRMSPQVHYWIYGYAARNDDFSQVLRWGGYRPVVFMAHGLATALFMCNTVLAAFTLLKARKHPAGLPTKPVAIYLLIILVACKSMAALIYGAVGAVLIMLTKPKTQLRACVMAALLVFLYPSLRASNNFPTEALIDAANSISADRGGSLAFRFMNEDLLLERVRERPYFGWGTYGRNSVYDAESGDEKVIVDGHWIIVLGTRGAVGAVAAFGLLLFPVFIALRRLRRIPDKRDQVIVGGLTLMVTLSTADLIPNGLFLNYPYFLAGALWGLVRVASGPQAQQTAAAQQAQEQQAAQPQEGGPDVLIPT